MTELAFEQSIRDPHHEAQQRKNSSHEDKPKQLVPAMLQVVNEYQEFK
jgi:hypothetical protein